MRNNGYTLIELFVIIGILSILFTFTLIFKTEDNGLNNDLEEQCKQYENKKVGLVSKECLKFFYENTN